MLGRVHSSAVCMSRFITKAGSLPPVVFSQAAPCEARVLLLGTTASSASDLYRSASDLYLYIWGGVVHGHEEQD